MGVSPVETPEPILQPEFTEPCTINPEPEPEPPILIQNTFYNHFPKTTFKLNFTWNKITNVFPINRLLHICKEESSTVKPITPLCNTYEQFEHSVDPVIHPEPSIEHVTYRHFYKIVHNNTHFHEMELIVHKMYCRILHTDCQAQGRSAQVLQESC